MDESWRFTSPNIRAAKAKAKVLAVAVAVDSVTQSLPVVDLVRNVMLVQRELLESSLCCAHSVFELLGHALKAAQAPVQVFRQHNLELFEQLHPHTTRTTPS